MVNFKCFAYGAENDNVIHKHLVTPERKQASVGLGPIQRKEKYLI
jgi:hypothetical protein